MSSMRTRNLIAGVILLLLSIGYGYMTAHLPTRAIENTTQPSFFPWVVATCLVILSVSLLAQSLLPIAKNNVPNSLGVTGKRLGTALILALAYLTALPLAGFVAANVPLFAGLMILYGERRPVRIGVGSIVISIIVFYIFRELFQIRLPAGVLDSVI
jgi:putative tricarboxylic transport membrane protein